MSLLKNVTSLVEKNEKAGNDKEQSEVVDHEKQKSVVKNKANPYMSGVPATADFGNLASKDVHDMLDAAEKKDDVETVTFGLETEEGDIVKVYVNVEDADKFEEALSQMLGKEDDIEKVLDELSADYDIVDVKWPDSFEDDEEEAEEDTDVEDDEETAAEKIMDTAKSSEDAPEDDDKTTEKVPEETGIMASLGQSFITRMLGEDKKLSKKEQEEKDQLKQNVVRDEEDNKSEGDPVATVITGDALVFEKELSNRYQRLAFQLSYLLGVPMSLLTLKRAAYKRNLRGVAEKMIDNSQLRIWSKRMANELARAEIAKTKDEIATVKEAGETLYDTLQSRIQREIYKLFVELGVPEDAMNQRRSPMRQLIVQLGVTFQKKQRLRVIFRMMLSSFGISEAPEATIKESEELFEADESELNSQVLSTFANQSTYGAWLFLKIAMELGIPAQALRPKLNVFKQQLIGNLRGKTAAVARLKALAASLGIDPTLTDKPVTVESLMLDERKTSEFDDADGEIDADAEVEVKDKKHHGIKGEDLGDWNVAGSGDRIVASVADKKIELDEEQYEKIISAMADGRAVSVLVQNTRVSFRPEHHGKIYVVKWNENHPTYPDGVIMSEKSVKTFMDAGAK